MNNYTVIGLLLLCVGAPMGCAAEPPRIASAAELREAAKPFLVQDPPTKSPDAGYGKRDREFIVAYLGSSDVDLRDAAADILVKNMLCYQRIRASLFSDYLGSSYPPNVRVVALAYSLCGVTAKSERRPQTEDRFATMKNSWSETLNAIAGQRAIPDDAWFALLISMSNAGGVDKVMSLLGKNERASLSDRLPGLLKGRTTVAQSTIVGALGAIGLDVAVPSLVKWYKQEADASTRLAVIENLGRLGISTPSVRVQLKPLLDLALSDLDSQIKTRTQVLLQ